ncbi:uncharacterized protein LOC128885093 [Hylaeus volcanicus]|uniref:uncharacterized protein LOC128885093 n=1 Tax=Hylaeus volcanicus TaxID=313075 RepID=UPI0023B82E5A|nr:uncharacterized protein LOC128885093 [Hylaeus volcanicus]
MQNLMKCIKYFSFFSLVNLADQMIGNSLTATEHSKLESNFDRAFKWTDFHILEQEKHGYLKEQELEPDGRYVSRIFFFTPDGNFIEDAYNKHEKADNEHKYFYGSPSHIAETQLFVLRECCEKPTSVTFDHEQSELEDWDTKNEILAPTLLSSTCDMYHNIIL